MKINHTLPLYTICTELGPQCVVFEGQDCLPVYRTSGMAQAYIEQHGQQGLHIEEFSTDDDVRMLLNTAKAVATCILWNPLPNAEYVAQSSVQEMLDLYAS